jgi:hypothetical protein
VHDGYTNTFTNACKLNLVIERVQMRNACKILVRKPEGKGPHTWEDNIRMNLRKQDGKL